VDEDYPWDEGDEGPSDSGESSLLDEERDVPTIDSKSGSVMSKARKSGFPLEWLLGVKQSGFSASSGGSQQVVSKKKGKGNKKLDGPEPEEEEYPENEEYDEELTNDEEWDDEEGGSRYAPINTTITITKVYTSFSHKLIKLGS
jgi:hypothetical protein